MRRLITRPSARLIRTTNVASKRRRTVPDTTRRPGWEESTSTLRHARRPNLAAVPARGGALFQRSTTSRCGAAAHPVAQVLEALRGTRRAQHERPGSRRQLDRDPAGRAARHERSRAWLLERHASAAQHETAERALEEHLRALDGSAAEPDNDSDGLRTVLDPDSLGGEPRSGPSGIGRDAGCEHASQTGCRNRETHAHRHCPSS